jgi:hypothetical protein
MVLAPITVPAASIAVAMGNATSVESGSTDMPDSMPCCPETQTRPDDVKNCPFMAVCSGTALQMIAAGPALDPPMTVLAVISPRDGAKLSGLALGPPARPPNA